MTPVEPWSDLVRLAEKPRRPVPFELRPGAGARAALAGRLGIPEIRKLRFAGDLLPAGARDWELSAALGATVVQACGVTLAPVVSRIDEPVTRRYLERPPELPDGTEIEMPQDETVEPLPAVLDLGAVMAEALVLALPPFPRAEGAELDESRFAAPGTAPMTDDEVKPFADLRRLLGGRDDAE